MTVHSHIYLLKNIHLFKQIYRVLYIFTMIKIFCIFLKLKINCSYMCVYLFLYHWIGKYANIFVIFQNSYFLFYVFFFFFGLFYLFCVFLVKFLYIFSCIIWKPAGGFHNNWAQHWTENWKSTMIKWISISNNFTQLY